MLIHVRHGDCNIYDGGRGEGGEGCFRFSVFDKPVSKGTTSSPYEQYGTPPPPHLIARSVYSGAKILLPPLLPAVTAIFVYKACPICAAPSAATTLCQQQGHDCSRAMTAAAMASQHSCLSTRRRKRILLPPTASCRVAAARAAVRLLARKQRRLQEDIPRIREPLLLLVILLLCSCSSSSFSSTTISSSSYSSSFSSSSVFSTATCTCYAKTRYLIHLLLEEHSCAFCVSYVIIFNHRY